MKAIRALAPEVGRSVATPLPLTRVPFRLGLNPSLVAWTICSRMESAWMYAPMPRPLPTMEANFLIPFDRPCFHNHGATPPLAMVRLLSLTLVFLDARKGRRRLAV